MSHFCCISKTDIKNIKKTIRFVNKNFQIKNCELFDYISFEYCDIQSGVYCYFWNGYCVYVGATSSIKSRTFRIFNRKSSTIHNKIVFGVANYAKPQNIAVLIVPTSKDKLKQIEKYLFDLLLPFSQVINRSYK